MRKSIVLAGLLALVPSLSQAKTLEDLLVEKGIMTKAEASAAAESGPAKIYWKKGTRLEFPSQGFEVKVNTQIQTRYTFTDNDDGVDNTSSFDVQRARLTISGKALNEEFSYLLMTDVVGSKDEGEKRASLRDAWLEWHGLDFASLKLGQYKTPYSRQFVTSSSKLQFPDRSAASEYFDLDRQVGLSASSKLVDGRLALVAGIFNGESDREGINRSGVDTNHTGVLSARFNVLGEIDSYEEGDIFHTEKPAVSIGGSYAYSDRNNDLGTGALEGDNVHSIAVDANVKAWGWSLHAELFNRSTDPDVSQDSDPIGFYTQLGWAFAPEKAEVAARYSYVDCDEGLAPGACSGLDKINEVTVGFNYFFWAHNLKAQVAYVRTNEDGVAGNDVDTNRWQFQLSAYF